MKLKKNIGVIFGLVLILQLTIYFSDINLKQDRTIEISFFSLAIYISFIFIYFEKWCFKLLIGIPTLFLGSAFITFEILSAFGPSEQVRLNWEINDYEIIYATEEYFAGKGSDPYIKLNRNYFFNFLYKTLEEKDTNLSFTELAFQNKQCIFHFEKSDLKFDICEKKQIE